MEPQEEKKVDLLAVGNIDPTQREAEPSDWYDKYPKPDIWDRFKVHFIDTLIVYVVYCLIFYLLIPGTVFNPGVVLIQFGLAIYLNAAQLMTWACLLITNGSTPGKKLFGHRVVRLDGKKLTLRDVIVRDLLIKGVCDFSSCGIMNIVSIIIAYVRPNSRAAHDVAANTITLDMRGLTEEDEPRVEFD